jgi:tetratricopeptide (TPR) repeat protein
LFRDPSDALERYKEEVTKAWVVENFEKANRLSDVYLRLYPAAVGAALNKALALRLLKKHELALAAYDHAIALAPDDPLIGATWLQRAKVAWEIGKADKVMESLMALHKAHPNELRQLFRADTDQGQAFKKFLNIVSDEAHLNADARTLLRTYYNA